MRSSTTRAARKDRKEPGPSIGIAGPYRWSRELLVSSISKRLKVTAVDLGQVDSELPTRIARSGVRLLVAEFHDAAASRVLERLNRRWPQGKILALTAPDSERTGIALVRKGVAGIVPADTDFGALVADLRLFWRNDWACTPTVARILFKHVGGSLVETDSPTSDVLSPREMQVALLLKQCLPNKLIADQLNISQGTVKNHIHRILRKMALARRSDIARYLTRSAAAIDNK